MLLIKALEAARERVHDRRREERAAAANDAQTPTEADGNSVVPPRPVGVEALLDLAEAGMTAAGEPERQRTRIVVHDDAAALCADGRGRSELEEGPPIAPETVRRLGCDADVVGQIDRDGLPVSVGRSRRTVPPDLRRILEARDGETCASLVASADVISRRTIAGVGRTVGKRASRISYSSALSIIASCTRAATPWKATPSTASASATVSASCGRSPHRGHRLYEQTS